LTSIQGNVAIIARRSEREEYGVKIARRPKAPTSRTLIGDDGRKAVRLASTTAGKPHDR
jgi:hypothetical protein